MSFHTGTAQILDILTYLEGRYKEVLGRFYTTHNG